MKVKDGFILRKVGRQFVVAATGEASKNFNGMIRLNDEAAFAFGLLQEGISEEELVAALAEKYGGNDTEVRTDVAHFLSKLKEADALV
jgi:hypothetical protein